MLTVNLICIGKLKESYLRDAQAEYCKRLCAFCKVNVIELSEHKLSNNPSDAEIFKGIEQEGDSIKNEISKHGTRSYTFSMCIEGKQLSSKELAQAILDTAVDGISVINFVIGGSNGLSDSIKARSDYSLSMSRMTFPHQLARVMLLEQLYRSFQINSNGKYHK